MHSQTSVDGPVPTGQSYPPAAGVPTQQGPRGLRFDVNLGARVLLPTLAEGAWRVTLRDLDTGNILFRSENQDAFVNSAKRWFVRFGIEVEAVDAAGAARSALSYDCDARGRVVLIQFPVGTLGDLIAWFSYAACFAERQGCRLTCALSPLLIPLFRDACPQVSAG